MKQVLEDQIKLEKQREAELDMLYQYVHCLSIFRFNPATFNTTSVELVILEMVQRYHMLSRFQRRSSTGLAAAGI